MAEQFILPKAKSVEVRNFVKAVKCTITSLQHSGIGWNPASRAAYQGMMGLENSPAPANRAGLPPHFYIEIPVKSVVPNNGNTDLVRRLSRGSSDAAGLLKALDAASQKYWTGGQYFDALNSELQKGNVSISIFHLDDREVTAAELKIVDGFPQKKE
jgi:hypothetical protein